MVAPDDFQPAKPILPLHGTIAILGGGQLGRMSAMSARRMGYRVISLDPNPDCAAAAVSDEVIVAAYDDPAGLERIAEKADVVTFEFENVSASALDFLEGALPARPGPEVLRICQNREREKAFFAEHGMPLPRVYHGVATEEDLARAAEVTGFPCVAKTSESGYDGKGQVRMEAPGDIAGAAAELRGVACVVEEWISFAKEISVICARTRAGGCRCFPVIENEHRDHILDVSIAPARIPAEVAKEAASLATRIAEAMDLEGLIAVEMFLTSDNRVLLNEIAPRPHNSGHFSYDASRTSQFEQHVRSICGLPLGDPASLCPAVMVNLLGDLWANGEPDWDPILRDPRAKLHLYGKEPRPKRKVGHITLIGETMDEVIRAAEETKLHLGIPGRIAQN